MLLLRGASASTAAGRLALRARTNQFRQRISGVAAARADAGAAEAKEAGQQLQGDDASLGPINKRPIDLNPRTYAYLLANTREHPVLRRCREGVTPRRIPRLQHP